MLFAGYFDIIIIRKSKAFGFFMAHQGSFEVEGVVKESLPNTLFRVELVSGAIILCHLSGKMRMNFIKILPGDKVRVEMTPYDKARGRIIYRFK